MGATVDKQDMGDVHIGNSAGSGVKSVDYYLYR